MSVLGPRARGTLARASVLSSIGLAACLPLGEPPSGRHLLAARDLEGIGFIEPAPGQRASIVTFRFAPVYDPPMCASFWSFFAVDDTSTTGGWAAERLLIDHAERVSPIDNSYSGGLGPYYSGPFDLGFPYALRTDARGRLFAAWQPTTPAGGEGDLIQCPPGRGRFARIDPATGARVELGSLYTLEPFGGELSSDRTRVVFTGASADAEPQPEVVLRDEDDREIRFAGSSPMFVGGDLYALGADHALVKVAADGVPQALVRDVSSFSAVPSERRLLLQLAKDDPAFAALTTFFDPATGKETALPRPEGQWPGLSVSPSGRFVMQSLIDYGVHTGTFVLVDLDTGAMESRSLTSVGNAYWRPGKDEYWMEGGEDDGKLMRWTPGQPLVTIDVSPGFGWFTSDERFWLRTTRTKSRTEARDPDDPGAPGYLLTPPGAELNLSPRTLADGRLLIELFVSSFNRHDIYVVDLAARTSRPIASGGTVVAFGRTRVLALLKFSWGGSDLSLVDLETGATTLIAQNTYRYAIEPPAPGQDPLAPGLRVLALVRNRIESPYDGLWLSTLP